jgi:hypothetical protein
MEKGNDSRYRSRSASHADAIIRAVVVREVAIEEIGHVADGALRTWWG